MKVGQTYRFEIPAFPGFTSQLRLHAVLPSSWRSCCNSLSPSIILGLWASRDTASSKQVTGQNSPEFQTGRFPPFSNRCPHGLFVDSVFPCQLGNHMGGNKLAKLLEDRKL